MLAVLDDPSYNRLMIADGETLLAEFSSTITSNIQVMASGSLMALNICGAARDFILSNMEIKKSRRRYESKKERKQVKYPWR